MLPGAASTKPPRRKESAVVLEARSADYTRQTGLPTPNPAAQKMARDHGFRRLLARRERALAAARRDAMTGRERRVARRSCRHVAYEHQDVLSTARASGRSHRDDRGASARGLRGSRLAWSDLKGWRYAARSRDAVRDELCHHRGMEQVEDQDAHRRRRRRSPMPQHPRQLRPLRQSIVPSSRTTIRRSARSWMTLHWRPTRRSAGLAGSGVSCTGSSRAPLETSSPADPRNTGPGPARDVSSGARDEPVHESPDPANCSVLSAAGRRGGGAGRIVVLDDSTIDCRNGLMDLSRHRTSRRRRRGGPDLFHPSMMAEFVSGRIPRTRCVPPAT